jgi:DNA-binding MarR family transcriptional regulator
VPVQPPQPDPAEQLLLAFTGLARDRRGPQLPARLEELLRTGAVAPRHFRAFTLIALSGSLTVSELAAREGCALSTASLLVTQLAEAGLVVRREDDLDRRCTVVSVAPAHRRESEQILAAKLRPLRRALERLGPARSKALLDGLAVVAEEIGAGETAPGASAESAGRLTKATAAARNGSARSVESARTVGR